MLVIVVTDSLFFNQGSIRLRTSWKNFDLKLRSCSDLVKILIGNSDVGKSRKNFDRKVRSWKNVGKILIGKSDLAQK
jgi:hypothetical protein